MNTQSLAADVGWAPKQIVEPISSSSATSKDPQRNNDGDSYEGPVRDLNVPYVPTPYTVSRVEVFKDKPLPLVDREKKQTALDTQVGGNHYKSFKIQPVEFCQINKLDYCTSNVIKYVCRHAFKNGLQDLEKAKHYIDLLIQMEYGDDKNQGLQTK